MYAHLHIVPLWGKSGLVVVVVWMNKDASWAKPVEGWPWVSDANDGGDEDNDDGGGDGEKGKQVQVGWFLKWQPLCKQTH